MGDGTDCGVVGGPGKELNDCRVGKAAEVAEVCDDESVVDGTEALGRNWRNAKRACGPISTEELIENMSSYKNTSHRTGCNRQGDAYKALVYRGSLPRVSSTHIHHEETIG